MNKTKTFALFVMLVWGLSANAREMLPVEAFASKPTVSQMSISPDGKHLAILVKVTTEENKGAAVRVLNIETAELTTLAFARDKQFVIRGIRWASNERLLLSALFPAVRHGAPTTESRLMSIDLNSREISSVLSVNYLRRLGHMPQIQDDIASIVPSDPDHILLEGRFDSRPGTGIIKVNLVDQRVKKVERSRPDVIDWVLDREHRPRIVVKREDTSYRIEHRPIGEKNWDDLWQFEAFAEDQVWPMGFDKDPDVLYVRAYHEGRLAVFKVRLSDPTLERELVFSDPYYDVNGSLIYSRSAGEVIGLRHNSGGGFTFWDPEYEGLQSAVDKALPDTTNFIYSMSDDRQRYVVVATSDTDAGTYYLGDRALRDISPIAKRYPDLPSELMAEKSAISYEARDGLTIEGYLTLPVDAGDDPLPAIIFPHGGPISYDDGSFDVWTQLFANRGYAVLQMNFRGSSGYGYDFMASGLQNWGLEMQNDVEDGTRWLIEQGIADPERICVVGASYGGYAALMEAARNPDLYQCVVSFAGVTDVAYLVSSYRRYTNYEVVKEQVGSDKSELRDRSPISHADAIDIPVLMAHGTDDRSVRVRHSQRMHRELEKEGKDVTYLEFEDGDHHLSAQEDRLAFFTAMDAFLQEHL